MRKVTQEVSQALKDGRKRNVGNSWTDGHIFCLHGNMIAEKLEHGIRLSMAGWPTVTTRERLNGILQTFNINGSFYQQKHDQFFYWAHGAGAGHYELPDYRSWIYFYIYDGKEPKEWHPTRFCGFGQTGEDTYNLLTSSTAAETR